MTRIVAMFGLCSLSCLFGWQTVVAVPPPLDSHHPLGGLRWQAHPGCQWGDGWDSWPLADFPVINSGFQRSLPAEVAAVPEVADVPKVADVTKAAFVRKLAEMFEVLEPADASAIEPQPSGEPRRDWVAGWELRAAEPVDLGVWPQGWAEAVQPAEAIAYRADALSPLQSVLIRWRRAAAEQHLSWVSERASRWSAQLGPAFDAGRIGQWWGRTMFAQRQTAQQVASSALDVVVRWSESTQRQSVALSEELNSANGDGPQLAAGASESLTH